jgi:DNA-binding transcriptional LysR family regulator
MARVSLPSPRPRTRPIDVGPLRTFAAVARHLNFRAAAAELALTQSAVSRQIQGLEDNVGALLFLRHTRSVQLTSAGHVLLHACESAIDQIDAAVRQIRQRAGRQSVAVTTWASFASMWLIPRLESFQRDHPEIDIRIDATDTAVDLATAEVDLALRYAAPEAVGADAVRLFGEQLTPVASPWLLRENPIQHPQDLARVTLIESGHAHRSRHFDVQTWQRWLERFTPTAARGTREGAPTGLSPQRWLYFNYANQIIQAALTGQGVALARTPMVAESLASSDLVEPLPQMRLDSPMGYWLLKARRSAQRPEVQAFCDWLLREAQRTRQAIGDAPAPNGPSGSAS